MATDNGNQNQQDAYMRDIDAEAREKGLTRERVLRERSGGQGIESVSEHDQAISGQQSNSASGQSDTGGYSQPENWPNRQPAPGSFQGQDQGQGSYQQQQSYDQSGGLQDGYRDTQGSSYDRVQGDPSEAQNVTDPTQSGIQPANNQPGKRVDAPGRETGTAWGQDQQTGSGSTTGTSERRNPAD